MPVPPADLTAGHLWEHGDGELAWWLAHGIAAPRGGLAMPGFAGALTEDQRWALIDWMRASNAGAVRAATGQWPVPVQAPGFEASCAGGHSVTMDDLRGRIVRIVFGPAHAAAGMVTVQVTRDPRTGLEDGLCIANGDDVWQAYAVVTATASGALPGTQVLVDGAGWLRAVHAPGTGPSWDDPAALQDALNPILAHPLEAPAASHAGMRM